MWPLIYALQLKTCLGTCMWAEKEKKKKEGDQNSGKSDFGGTPRHTPVRTRQHQLTSDTQLHDTDNLRSFKKKWEKQKEKCSTSENPSR